MWTNRSPRAASAQGLDIGWEGEGVEGWRQGRHSGFGGLKGGAPAWLAKPVSSGARG